MTAVLKLDYISNETTAIDSLSLLDFTDGFDLAENGWVPKVPNDSSTTLTEVFTLRSDGGTPDGLAGLLQTLDEYKQHVMWSRKAVDMRGVWLTCQMNNESAQRRALVVKLDYQIEQGFFDNMVERLARLPELTLIVERSPYWEELYQAQNEQNNTGNQFKQAGVIIEGDVPARLSWVRFYSDGASEKHIDQIWAAWRSSRLGTAANFQPVWSLKDGLFQESDSGLSLDVSSAADETAFTGTRLECDFSVEEAWYKRCMMSVAMAAPAHIEDQAGNFLVLLRAKVATTTTTPPVIRAGIGFGVLASARGGSLSAFTLRDKRLMVADGLWHYYSMGMVTFPPTKRFLRNYTANTIGNCAIGVYAERLAGTEDLLLDHLLLLPADDGLVYAKPEFDVEMQDVSNESLVIAQDPLGQIAGYIVYDWDGNDQAIYGGAQVEAMNWGMPNDRAEVPYLITAHDSTAYGSDLSIDLAIDYYPYRRWRTLRGADGAIIST